MLSNSKVCFPIPSSPLLTGSSHCKHRRFLEFSKKKLYQRGAELGHTCCAFRLFLALWSVFVLCPAQGPMWYRESRSNQDLPHEMQASTLYYLYGPAITSLFWGTSRGTNEPPQNILLSGGHAVLGLKFWASYLQDTYSTTWAIGLGALGFVLED